MNLDDRQAMEKIDSADMLRLIRDLPDQCQAAWRDAQQLTLPREYAAIDQLVIVGMGGSAIGGALLEGLVADECEVPISVVRGYSLPASAGGSDTLVVACSYSGNTEETLSCFEQARERDARLMVISTDGKLTALAKQANLPVIEYGYQSPPRAALGYSFGLLLGAVHQLGLVHDHADEIAEAAEVMRAWDEELAAEVLTAENPAKQLAAELTGGLPVLYGAGFLAAVANRWKTQFNENAKQWAFFEVLPELNHNAVAGFANPESVRKNSVVLMLRSALDSRRIQKRWDVTRELLEREGVSVEEVYGRGESALAQMLSLIHFGDYVSFYAAMLNGVDPTPIEPIAFLKQRLAELGKIVG